MHTKQCGEEEDFFHTTMRRNHFEGGSWVQVVLVLLQEALKLLEQLRVHAACLYCGFLLHMIEVLML